jgi:Spy/CpxP family protein refolding chaperone
MRTMKLGAALGVGLLLSGTALAQQPPGGGGFGGGGGLVNSIARSKPLQDELKVDAGQLEKLTAALTKAREDSRELLQKLIARDTSTEERTEIGKKLRELNEKAVADALKPEQVKRMRQLEHQQAGLNFFIRSEAAKPLNLTDEQKEKITAVSRELATDRREVQGAAGRGGFGRPVDPEIQKKLDSLQKEAMANAVKVLTDEQKTAYKDLTGEPFEGPLPAQAFGGAGGIGGGFGQPGGAGGFGGGFGGGGQPGIVLSTTAQTTLKLTDEQKKELEQIQKDVASRLEKMLTEEQRKQLKEMQERQPNRGGQPGQPGRGGRTPKKDN